MKNLTKFLVLIIGMTSFVTMAQNADSVIVIYDNQKTIIPLPAFGKKTTIKMSDSIQIIEISVSKIMAKDEVMASSEFALEKPAKKTKWFSQVESGYAISVPVYNFQEYFVQNGNFNGYKLGISVREKERFVNKKISIVSGVNLGYIQSFRDVYHSESSESPSEVFRSSFPNISFPLYFKYHFSAFDLPANIHVGANLVYGYMFISRYDNKGGIQKEYDNGLIFVEPRMGIEIGKLGLNIASAWNLFPEMCFYNQIKSINSISLSYRLF